MKKRIALFSLGIIINVTIFSQPLIFEKIFDWSSYDIVRDFIPTEDNGFALLGSSGGQSFVMKLDSNGDSLWTFFIGQGGVWHTQIIQSQNTDLLIASQYFGDAILLRLSNSGDSISSIIYPYINDDNTFTGVLEMDNGDLVVSDRMESDGGNYPPGVTLRCFNPDGNLKWSKGLGGEHYPFNMILTSDNEIVVSGVYDWWDMKIWIVKYDSIGNFISGIIGDAERGNQIIESSSGDLYASVDGYSSNGSYNAVKLNDDCTVEWKLFNYNGIDWYSHTICELKPNRFAIGGANQNGLAIKIFDEDGDSISFFNYDEFYVQYASRLVSNQVSLTVGGFIKDPDDNYSISVMQILLDSLYTSNKPIQIKSQQSKTIIFPNPANNVIYFNNFQDVREPATV